MKNKTNQKGAVMRRVSAPAAIAVLLFVQMAAAAPVKFLLASRDGRNVIKFISKAPLETIELKLTWRMSI